MSSFSSTAEGTLRNPEFKLRQVGGPLDQMTDDQHAGLLDYLMTRLKTNNSTRSTRVDRYARIDKLISTWQKLSPDDTIRELTEDNTGKSFAIAINLPILSAHLEDMVSFFAEVFAPQRRNFFVVPDTTNAKSISELAMKMNRDTKARGYYAEVCKTIRALAKYNVGGFAVRWEAGGGIAELAQPGNRIEAIDMYNYLWDTTVTDVAKICTDAEWAARVTVKNQTWVSKKGLRGEFQRIDKVLKAEKERDGLRRNTKKTGTVYRSPPNHVGLTIDGRDQQTSKVNANTVNWESYGAGLEGDNQMEIQGFEVTEMYCWLNPWEFKLVDETNSNPDSKQGSHESGLDENGQGYQLWRFVIIDGCQVVFAQRIISSGTEEPQIPHYMGFMNRDDMKEAQRSVMELLKPFQRFASFLMNIFVSGARKNIWGMKGVDPSMFDTSQFEHGEVAGWLKSKIAGRDVRTGLIDLKTESGVQEAMTMLSQTLEVMRSLFPSQALPAQIAGIDRAVKNQVSAVMQGVHRRLHMVARTMDSDIFAPLRLQCYRNISNGDNSGLTGLTEEDVAKLMGSGLQSLNAEAAATELREILFAIIQNQEAMQAFDLPALFTFWSQLQNLPTDLGTFVRQPAAPVNPGDVSDPAAAAAAAAAGLPAAQ